MAAPYRHEGAKGRRSHTPRQLVRDVERGVATAVDMGEIPPPLAAKVLKLVEEVQHLTVERERYRLTVSSAKGVQARAQMAAREARYDLKEAQARLKAGGPRHTEADKDLEQRAGAMQAAVDELASAMRDAGVGAKERRRAAVEALVWLEMPPPEVATDEGVAVDEPHETPLGR